MTVAENPIKTDKSTLLENFWQQLGAASNGLLLLDYDGTLAPFRVERDEATPYPGIREILAAIRRDTATRLVIISGRAIDVLRPLLGLEPPPEMWGCHGWERLDSSGTRQLTELPESAAAGLRAADRWVVAAGLEAHCEHKPASLAIHWRGLPDQQVVQLADQVRRGWLPLAATAGLEVHDFNGGLELRCPGKSKGTAIRSVLAEVNQGTPVAFLGDDLTDEDGFAALAGQGLGVLVSNQPRPTRAQIRIEPPGELLDFLATWHARAPRQAVDRKGV